MNVRDFYERHPYPPPVDDLDAYRQRWNDDRRRAESHLFWPSLPYRDDRTILVAGCGTAQAARYAVRWPRARVVGIDVSETSLAFTRELKRKHNLENLEVRHLPLERAREVGETFDFVVCTGVLHHLADPDAGLSELAAVLARHGAMHLMVYAPYGRAGVSMIADYCRRLGVTPNETEIADLAATLRALPPGHPLVELLRTSPDFGSIAGVADALLHPRERTYSVPQLFDFLAGAGLTFGRWIRQAPYLPWCGALANTPHGPRLAALEPQEYYAAIELFRGTMTRHSLVAYAGADLARPASLHRSYVPLRVPDTTEVRERLPEGAAAVLINRAHEFVDLFLPIDGRQARMLAAIDGKRPLSAFNDDGALEFFERLWRWDQVVFDTSGGGASSRG